MSSVLPLIINPSAGGGRATRELPRVANKLEALGFTPMVHFTRDLADATRLGQQYVNSAETIAVMGGDGVMAAVASAVHNSSTSLALLPAGRGNDFARKLGIPSDPGLACDHIRGGTKQNVDVGLINGKVFLGICSAGIDSVVQEITNSTRLPLGSLIYLYGALRALGQWHSVRWDVKLDGIEESFVGYSVAVCNSGVYGGGMQLAPNARLDDGLLDVVMISDVSKLRFLRTLPKVFKGNHLEEPGVRIARVKEVEFTAERPFRAYADGDPIADLPALARVDRGALSVLGKSVP